MKLLNALRARSPLPAAAALLGALLAVPAVFAIPTSSSSVTAARTPTLRINECLASNTRIANGSSYPDLIELHNAGTVAMDLAGKSLTDDRALKRKYVFPSGTSIPAGGYLVIYADTATTLPGLHTGFSLDAEGDQVLLYDLPGSDDSPLDEIAFGFQFPDHSVSRTGAGSNIWTLTLPTPGAANGAPVGLGSVAGLKLNEWAGKITFRLDHDLIELFNPAPQPVAIGGVRLTDDITKPDRFKFPPLSFVAGTGFLPLYGADFVFGLDGDRETVTLAGENNERIDQVTLISQALDRSSGRTPDGSATIVDLPIPSPGISNQTPLPAAYTALLNSLRITELMYQPAAPSNSSSYEYIELQNLGTSPLDLSGVRFTNGLDYEFPVGMTLAAGAYIVIVNDRSSFLSRYPGAAGAMAPGGYNGGLDNTGETIALTLPAPWDVHILRFRFEPSWQPSASGGGKSLVVGNPALTPPQDWDKAATWRASAAVNGSPGAAEPGTTNPTITARLSNLSVRTTLASGQILIVGSVMDGGSREVLIRAVGPTLASFGLGNVMADPRLELYSGSTVLFSNDDWPANLAPTFASVGAFPLPAGSKDAALVQSISGARTIQAKGTAGGVVLVEAYDLGSGNSPRLVNVSARNIVGTGDGILIAGFNIAGTGSKKLLVRAVGPTLASFGVAGTLGDPKLEIYTGTGVKVTENDTWDPALTPTFAAVGAFPLNAGSKDAALLTTLPIGGYTVQVRGADGGTGEALVELYEVP